MILNSFLPSELMAFLLEIEERGFSLCLVGGAVRDYLAEAIVSSDLDFEIRANSQTSDEEWPVYYERLIKFFEENKIKITRYPYLITKIDFTGWSLEFSSPRLEVFEDPQSHSHHNFKALLSSNLIYSESFKRRDFTINAMGFELSCKNNSMKLIDPFHGEKHLQEKKLCFIDQNFFKDSVRFLRMIRFSVKYELAIDDTLVSQVSQFNLSALSKYHFTSELFKTDPGKFLNHFKKLVKRHKIQLPEDFIFWADEKIDWPVDKMKTREDVLSFVFHIQRDTATKVQDFFSLPQKKLRELIKNEKAGTE